MARDAHPMTRMRIAFVLNDFDMGGMPTWVYRLATRLHRDHELHFLCTEVDRIAPKFEAVGRPRFCAGGVAELVDVLRAERVAVVQYGQRPVYGEAAMAAGVPVVIERTDGWRQGLPHVARGLDAIVASTRSTAEGLRLRFGHARVRLIHNGVDLPRFDRAIPDRLGFGPEDILVGRVSRFGGGKNLGLLIDAIAVLKDRHPRVRLVLVGGNSRMPGAADEAATLRERARGLEPWVRFVGSVDEPESLIAGFDIGTCVSRQGNEGVPNSLMECMAASMPVVATRVDDIPELVTDGKDGLLVDDGNLDQLVAALDRLIADATLRREMGRAGRTRIARDFDLDTQAEKYRGLYAELLGGTPRVVRRLTRGVYGRMMVHVR